MPAGHSPRLMFTCARRGKGAREGGVSPGTRLHRHRVARPLFSCFQSWFMNPHTPTIPGHIVDVDEAGLGGVPCVWIINILLPALGRVVVVAKRAAHGLGAGRPSLHQLAPCGGGRGRQVLFSAWELGGRECKRWSGGPTREAGRSRNSSWTSRRQHSCRSTALLRAGGAAQSGIAMAPAHRSGRVCGSAPDRLCRRRCTIWGRGRGMVQVQQQSLGC